MKQFHIIIILMVALMASACSNKEANTLQENPAVQPEGKATKDNDTLTLYVDSNPSTVSCIGKIKVPPSSMVEITAGINANLYNISVLPGQEVRKGQELGKLKNRSIIDLQSKYLMANVEAENLSKDFDRKKSLFDENALSEKEYLSAKSLYQSKVAEKDGLKAQLEFIGISPSFIIENGIQNALSLRAPITGTIVSINGNEGAYISESQSIFTIVNLNEVHLDLDVFAKDAALLKKGQDISFKLNGHYENYTAKVMLISPSADMQNTLQVHADIINGPKNIIIGSTINAEINVGNYKTYLLDEKWVIKEGNRIYCKIGNNEIDLDLGDYKGGKYQVFNYIELQAKM